MQVKKGNQVKVITGKDKGKTGEILEIDRKFNRVKIKAINNNKIIRLIFLMEILELFVYYKMNFLLI